MKKKKKKTKWIERNFDKCDSERMMMISFSSRKTRIEFFFACKHYKMKIPNER